MEPPQSPPVSSFSPVLKHDRGCKSFDADGETYSLQEVLGEGSYGSVYRCLRARDSAVFAAKIIDTMRIGFVGGTEGVRAAEQMASREVDALRKVSSHANIISLEGAFFSNCTGQVFIVTEFVQGSHLFSHVVQRTVPLKEPEASHIVAQVSDAVSFCHALGVVHRDLKLENVLVSSIDVRLVERPEPHTGVTGWQTEELFSVKICDFGFAKPLQRYTTRTPVGTVSYTAPEVPIEREASGQSMDATDYDAFKADAFSLGVLLFVMLCLGFPPKDAGESSHRSHKVWPALSRDAQFLIDGLLSVDPRKRLGILDVYNHPWVVLADLDDEGSLQRSISKQAMLDEAEVEFGTTRRAPQPRWSKKGDQMQDPALPGILGLCRALVHIQQERGMACWALAGAPGLGGISVWDQLQWHIQLTEKHIGDAKGLLDERRRPQQLDLPMPLQVDLSGLFATLAEARKQVFSMGAFDDVFMIYNKACGTLIETVAGLIEAARPGYPEELCRAARRYRLCSAAVEQLGRERAMMSGLRCVDSFSLENPEVVGPAYSSESGGRGRLHRLAEILGARKILLGTMANDHSPTSSDIVATSTGLLGALLGEGHPSLLGADEICELESIEHRMFTQTDQVPTEVLYQTITRLMNEIHSRIAIALVEDMRPSNWVDASPLSPVRKRRSGGGRSPRVNGTLTPLPEARGDMALILEEEPARRRARPENTSCCRTGLRRFFQSLADSL